METMKQTGIQWIGEIPSTWDLIRTKHFSYMKGRIGWQGLTADEFIEEGPYLVTGTDFENGRVCWERSYHISEKRYDEAPQIQLTVGDLLVTKDGTIGKLAYIDQLPGKASLNSHLLVMRPLKNKYINRFLYWMLSSSVFIEYYTTASNGSTMDSLSQEKMGDFVFPTPPIDEQEAIADFLDEHCGELDSIITDLEKQIEMLKAYKKSLITEAVTKGLNKKATMKDSKNDWIGSIPKHWSIQKTKYVADFFNGNRSERYPSGSEIVDEGIPFVNSENIHGLYLDEINRFITPEKYKSLGGAKIKKDDIIYCLRGSVGMCAINKIINCGTVASSLVVIRAKTVHPDFLNYVFQSGIADTQTLQFQNGSCAANLSAENVGQYIFAEPPIKEQIDICTFLDKQLQQLEAIINNKLIQSEKIKKHQASLIFEYVTGKKRVKEVQ